MKITERQKSILEKVIDEYIETAYPVSSQLLEKKYDFGICPAMIRIEMEKLTDAGFLDQPFISAGRVPTDKGYRFFVDRVLDTKIPEFRGIEKMEKELREERDDVFGFTTKLARLLAKASSNMAMLHLLEDDLIVKDGWEELMREPEFANRDLLFGFTDFLEDWEENIDDLKLNSDIKVYIGKENPVGKKKNFSTISSKCRLPGKKEGVVSLVGPTRMPYEKNISIMKSLVELMDNF